MNHKKQDLLRGSTPCGENQGSTKLSRSGVHSESLGAQDSYLKLWTVLILTVLGVVA